MTIHVLTLFPKMFEMIFNESIILRAQKKGLIKINIHNLRDWAHNKRKTVDDSPYGGGAGMVLKVDVIDRAIASLKSKIKTQKSKIILLTPQGKTFNQKRAKTLSQYSNLLLICGHYEGFDERVRKLADEEISIGNYVLTGGEIPAMVLIDSISRLIHGVLGKNKSSQEESFSMKNFLQETRYKKQDTKFENCKLEIENCLEYPHYTRPESYRPISKNYKRELKVPKILLSGNHTEIKKWRIKQSLRKSKRLTSD
ncbi:tRNA (guanosine(37)-N1)-methyltransferase TrmD [Candidatus Berkelbacteria bacterium RIFCSPHIGHO2_12_FULL_36_9]|uniref:tRNA (guanine-N(1)-)-methyltransferase n=1 Tax=Candidatus Berkelbacteria bacterium RIFCSPHIGHO2_12_FULL_36_9 TaxID=1797469 RepID=A0A1F5EKD4_9BACT|nr:MAG: tRNA (guanosine(37)-N1)-methyltransferase TrmD [Candidatus Berkelbacteria bacterium RIFCSPHIGHO2_12_FULL_36_9]